MTTSSSSPTVTLYHGTGNLFEGPPTKGGKDVLRTGYPSFTGDPDVAEFFAGGSRDARIYSVEVPRERILDLTDDRDARRRNWRGLSKKVEEAAAGGMYDAVAIPDITFGDDEPEYRLFTSDPDAFSVHPSSEYYETYGDVDDVLARARAGQGVDETRQAEVRRILLEDVAQDAEMIRTMDSLRDERPELVPAIPLRAKRILEDRETLRALRAGDTDRLVGVRVAVDDYVRARESGELPIRTGLDHALEYHAAPEQRMKRQRRGRGFLRF